MPATATRPAETVTLAAGDACIAVDEDGLMTPGRATEVDETGALVAPDDGGPPVRADWGDIYVVPTGPRVA
jgi:hypothetical protein